MVAERYFTQYFPELHLCFYLLNLLEKVWNFIATSYEYISSSPLHLNQNGITTSLLLFSITSICHCWICFHLFPFHLLFISISHVMQVATCSKDNIPLFQVYICTLSLFGSSRIRFNSMFTYYFLFSFLVSLSCYVLLFPVHFPLHVSLLCHSSLGSFILSKVYTIWAILC